MAKNHYVSQLIIKRFAPSITTFDTQNKCLIENRQAHKIFYKNDIYDDDIELKLAHDLEQPFAALLDEKILHSAKVILTRQELFLVKQFLLLDSVRTYTPDFFVHVLKGFRKNAEDFLRFSGGFSDGPARSLPSTFELGLDGKDIQMRAMQLFLECKTAEDIAYHPLATKELYCWAKVNIDSYLTFWDSDETQEFILTSTGMVSEYEPSHEIFGGLDLSKFSYLLEKLDKDNNEIHKSHYAQFLAFNRVMYENFNIFNLSATRCMVLVHPFFRLYSNFQGVLNGEEITVEKPDIWPTCFETKEICLPPDVHYLFPPFRLPGDEFQYTPKKLSAWDTIYLNALILHQTHEVLGFHDVTKIIDSLAFVNLLNSVSDKELLDQLHGLDALSRWIDNMLKDKYYYIFQYYRDLDLKCKTNPFELLEKFGDLKWEDIRSNRYVLSYLLSNEELVKAKDNFAFMGPPQQRIAALKQMLKKLN